MRRFVVAALLAPILTDCGGSEPSGPAVLATITLSPIALSLASLGQTHQVTSTVNDQSGTAIANAAVTWSSSDTSVAGRCSVAGTNLKGPPVGSTPPLLGQDPQCGTPSSIVVRDTPTASEFCEARAVIPCSSGTARLAPPCPITILPDETQSARVPCRSRRFHIGRVSLVSIGTSQLCLTLTLR